MIRLTYISHKYRAADEKLYKRYVRRDAMGDHYSWCEVDPRSRRFDVRQGDCDASDLPDSVRKAADQMRFHYPAYVKWPRD